MKQEESGFSPELLTQAEKRMATAKTQILLNFPFFAQISMNLSSVVDPEISGVQVDYKNIYYNPEYIMKLNLDQTITLLLKVICHVVQLHPSRKQHREDVQFNVAASHAVNLMLEEAGMKLPEDAIKDSKYKDMTAEHIYNLLPEDPKFPKQKQSASGKGEYGGVRAAKADPGGESVEEQETNMKEMITAAAQMAKQAGNLPGGMQRFLKDLLEPKVNWREELAAFVTEKSNDDYSWKHANRRFLHTGFIFPTLYSETIGTIILVVDTSGSISQQQLNCFGSELRSIASMFNVSIRVMYVDTVVANEQIIEPDDDTPLEPQGFGGTMFSPAYNKLAKEGETPACLIYFTDGYCDEYPNFIPEYPVMWALWGGMKGDAFHPPFGTVLEIDELG